MNFIYGALSHNHDVMLGLVQICSHVLILLECICCLVFFVCALKLPTIF